MPKKLKARLNPRRKVENWREILEEIDFIRRQGTALAEACAHFGISTNSYWHWNRRRTLVVSCVDTKKKVVTVRPLKKGE